MKTKDSNATAPDLWHEYLRSENHTAYDGTCSCVYCKLVREDFHKWKAKRLERTPPNTEVSNEP